MNRTYFITDEKYFLYKCCSILSFCWIKGEWKPDAPGKEWYWCLRETENFRNIMTHVSGKIIVSISDVRNKIPPKTMTT